MSRTDTVRSRSGRSVDVSTDPSVASRERPSSVERPWSLALGLYQGDAVEQKLRATYLAGLQEVMLKPTAAAIASYLSEVNANAAQLQPLARAADGSPTPAKPAGNANPEPMGVYSAASTSNVSDAYNALKTYIMLGDRSRTKEAGFDVHLTKPVNYQAIAKLLNDLSGDARIGNRPAAQVL
jgi:type VI protein secretion system component VasK